MKQKLHIPILLLSLCSLFCTLPASAGISSVSVTQNANCTGRGNQYEPILSALITVTGDAAELTSVDITLDGTTDINDYEKVKIYSTGSDMLKSPTFDDKDGGDAVLLGEYEPQSGTMTCNLTTPVTLASGFNFIWVVAAVSEDAKEGNKLDATLVSLTAGDETIAVSNGNPDGSREILMISKLLYSPGDNGSTAYRIPAMVILPNGNIVTAIDRRWDSEADLANRIDIIARISEDGGYTWSEEYPIATASDAKNGRGDCALVVAPNGDIIAAFVGGNGLGASSVNDPISSFISRSSDGGKTWTPVEEGGQGDITSQIWGPDCNGDATRLAGTAAFFGSGRGLCLSRQRGENADKNGRIMFVTAVRNNGILYNYVVYSDDNGLTWKVSEQAYSNGDESKVAELNDGTILMSVRRTGSGANQNERGYVTSTDGGETWSEEATWSDLKVNACNGDILEYTTLFEGYDKNRTLHSLPINDGSKSRAKVSIYLSYDEGKTWTRKKQLFSGNSAYSTMIKLPDGTIGVYAEDQQGGTTKNYFMRFSLAWLTDGEDIYTAPPAGVEEIQAGDDTAATINAGEGRIEITSPETIAIAIYDIDGTTVKSLDASQSCSIAIEPGAYIVKAGDTVKKLIVK